MTASLLKHHHAQSFDLLVVAGEHSGDQHAAQMVEELISNYPSCQVATIGGINLQQSGAFFLHDLVSHGVVGFLEVLEHYPYFRKLMDELVAWIRTNQPRVLCLVDYPGFHLRLAKRLADEGLSTKGGGITKVIYYISPQVWAWKKKRRFTMARYLDALSVLFPFEKEVFRDTSLEVEYVGHPFARNSETHNPFTYDRDGPIWLLPGSRSKAVSRIFPILLNAWQQLDKTTEKKEACVLYPDSQIYQRLLQLTEGLPQEVAGRLHFCDQKSIRNTTASAVLTSSGTMSLKVALAGIPGAIVYRANPLTYLLGKQLVSISYLGMANILLDTQAWPEYLQHQAKASLLKNELHDCLMNESRREKAKNAAEKLEHMLSTKAECSPAQWLAKKLNDAEIG